MQKDTFLEKILVKNDNSAVERNRLTYLVQIVIVIFIGLFSRKIADQLPKVINLYLGDALWALMIFLIAGFVFNKLSRWRIAVFSLLFCYSIEVSQLYHAPWIDVIRSTNLGGLVLGFGFLWSDILAYSFGVCCGYVMEKSLLK